IGVETRPLRMVLVRVACRLVAAPGGHGLAQRAVRRRLRRTRGRGRAGRWRPGRARRALAGLASAPGRIPDAGPGGSAARGTVTAACEHRRRTTAGRTGFLRGMSADIAAIVVTHQSASTIDDCLSRLRLAEGVAAIRVVDNHSMDDTVAVVQRHATADARVRFVANPDNPGFAVACNQGAADAGDAAAWLAFVNPDCMVETDTLVRLRAHARSFRGEALVGADLVGEDGKRDNAARRR